MIPVSEEEFLEWTQNPVTQRLMDQLLQDREEMKERLANNAVESTERDEVVGRCKAVALLLNIEYGDLYGQ
jgi:DNA polymerase elongation subunit (family B)